MRFNCTQKFSPSGNMEQDDANNWFNSTALAKSRTARAYPLNMQIGMGHEFNVKTHPGVSFNRTPSEANWRHFYGFWAQLMEAPSWSQMKLDPITSASKRASHLI